MTRTQQAERDQMDAVTATGEFLTLDGERYYAIRNVDAVPPFFSSIISNSDHWMFISSSGGLTAGRVAPERALFPYVTVDKVHESAPHTGSRTLLRVHRDGREILWEPFNREHDGRFSLTRNLYKTVLGHKICFEEVNHDLEITFRYRWCTSDSYGFVRQCELAYAGATPVHVDLLDGLQNILPAGTPKSAQDLTSNLVDAYKWSELNADSGLAIYCLYSGISDRAEPSESLRATTVFSLGLERQATLLCSEQLANFRRSGVVGEETCKRGVRGAFMITAGRELAPGESLAWQMVCGLEQSQGQVIALQQEIANSEQLARDIEDSIAEGGRDLARIMASSDGFQATAEENVSVHHYANTLFNVLRGGIFDRQYAISRTDLSSAVRHFNQAVWAHNASFLAALPDSIQLNDLVAAAEANGDPQLERLCFEYLPITFGRRHGDPSRPWNRFSIKLRDKHGERLLSYEGNWRDIFQNWEALTFSYPEFIEGVIAKFVNASTMDGYNPYRITNHGIDWEVEDADDPWSYIGYWGDHQIIYLLKLLELSRNFHPERLGALLYKPIFGYANVPYRIKPFAQLLADSKSTVVFDSAAAELIEARVASMGADGKLVLDQAGKVRLVSLMEKLLVPLLAKLGNLVVDGGIWLNTQRPEWNDANNALVGNGLSMVTLYYLRRYIAMLQGLLAETTADFEFSAEVAVWMETTKKVLATHLEKISAGPLDDQARFAVLSDLGTAASDYRESVYVAAPLAQRTATERSQLAVLLSHALAVTDLSIARNRRQDGLYHAYNLLDLRGGQAGIERLYLMLEGQVAVLSSGTIAPEESACLIESLFDSDIYRPDQKSFTLYPDRQLPGFFEKNTVDSEGVERIPLLRRMLEKGDRRLIYRDAAGTCRFSADFANAGDLADRLQEIAAAQGGKHVDADRAAIEQLYEDTFHHHAFTGRSGGMFGFEGLGCIYWHMVAKLLLAAQETYFRSADSGADAATTQRLAGLYYRVREGLGFNKTPQEYGAFPTDPYSHTPGHAGAQQPGMTGQVKEEVLTRFGELGVRVANGEVAFEPSLLRAREFLREPTVFRHLDVDDNWQAIHLPEESLAFTWCQVPCCYHLTQTLERSLLILLDDGREQLIPGHRLTSDVSREIFRRSGRVRKITVQLARDDLFGD